MSGYQSLKIKLREMEEHNEFLLRSNKALVNEAVENGEHLANQIFIPEYLGFEETEVEDKNTFVTFSRIYSKDKFRISRAEGNAWVIINPKREKNVLYIDNMLDGINALKMSGMEITPRSVMDQELVTRQLERQIEENVSETIQKLGNQKKIE